MPLGSGTIRNVRRLQVLFSSLECPTSLGESVDSSMQSNTKKRVYLTEGREKFIFFMTNLFCRLRKNRLSVCFLGGSLLINNHSKWLRWILVWDYPNPCLFLQSKPIDEDGFVRKVKIVIFSDRRSISFKFCRVVCRKWLFLSSDMGNTRIPLFQSL